MVRRPERPLFRPRLLSDPAPTFLADPPGASLTAPRVSLGGMPPPRVGLLGGSFNPAHAGHRHISLEALKRLDLDEVWWLVAPQNPLKPARGMAPFKTRLGAAAKLADDRRIKVLDLEAQLGTHYTVDTLAAKRYAHQRAAPEAARRLAELAPPVWAFLPIRLDTSSATDIRSHRAPRRKGKGRRTAAKRR